MTSTRKSRLNPSQRQDILATRLHLTILRQNSRELHSKKRALSSSSNCPSSSIPSIYELEGTTDPFFPLYSPIDEQSTYKEIAHIFPLLSYGEESNDLFSGLLALHYNDAYCFKNQMMEAFHAVLENLLTARAHLQRQHAHNGRMTSGGFACEERAKQQKVLSHCPSPQTENELYRAVTATDCSSNSFWPWNILLRFTIRLTAFYTQTNKEREELLEKSNSRIHTSMEGDDKSKEYNTEQVKNDSMKITHPIFQALNHAIADLSVILRTKSQKEGRTVYLNSGERETVEETSSIVTHGKAVRDEEILPKKTNQSQMNEVENSICVTDRFICHWKNGSRCGPSRYAFLKDVEYISKNLNFNDLNLCAEEWCEKLNLIIRSVDEYVGFGDDNVSHIGVGVSCDSSLLQSPFCSVSKSRMRDPTKNASFSTSLVDITRFHVKRALGVEKDVMKAIVPTSSDCISDLNNEKFFPDVCTSGSKFERLLDVDTASLYDSEEVEFDRSKDAYQMAIAFSATNCDRENAGVRHKIERRLEVLVQKLCRSREGSLNVDGAESYLRTLLHELLRPSDLDVWLRLMKESFGQETSHMLRKGRASLVSYLIGIKAPGWEDVCELEKSPVAAYLGCFRDCDEREDTTFQRSSFLLPLFEAKSSMPSPPIVTELGLIVCVSNFLQKGVSHSGKFGSGSIVANSMEADKESILAALPDVRDLTRELFNLTLRLAAYDDSEHRAMSFPLCLATPSASESLQVVLDVVSEHSDWLDSRCIFLRYQAVIEMILLSFQCGYEKDIYAEDKLRSGRSTSHSSSWRMRVLSLIRVAKSIQNRGRLAFYATHFMIILCGSKSGSKQVSSQLRPHFYHCLDLCKYSSFWHQIDKEALDNSASIMAKVFNHSFCVEYLLPLSHQCSMLHAAISISPLLDQTIPLSELSESILSVITILYSILTLLANDGLLNDCLHVRWSIEILLLSIDSFIKCETIDSLQIIFEEVSGHSMWKETINNLRKLFSDVWGEQVSYRSLSAKENCVVWRSIENKSSMTARTALMPTLEVLVASLVKFSISFDSVEGTLSDSTWCKFVTSVLLERYIEEQQSGGLLKMWIGHLTSNIKNEVMSHQHLVFSKRMRKDGKSVDDESIKRILNELMTPLLKLLHSHMLNYFIQSKVFHSNGEKHNSPLQQDLVAFAFVELFKQESCKFLNKPSQMKTRTWTVYRYCIEKVFLLTPPSKLFMCSSQPGLSEYSADALHKVWSLYGQCCHSQSTFIMVAAGLHVNDSATRLQYGPTNNDSQSIHLKHLFNTFTIKAKECIASRFNCFGVKATTRPLLEAIRDFGVFVSSVRRELTFNLAVVGLSWWNELTADLITLLAHANNQTIDQSTSFKTPAHHKKDVSKLYSILENNLSKISGS